MQNLLIGVKFFLWDLLSDFARWPIWWYSSGAVLFGKWMITSIQGYSKSLAIGVWVKNIFVPMFGRRDWQSRLISIFMRFVQILARSLFLFVWTLLMGFIFCVYIVLPAVAVVAMFYQLLVLLSA